MFYIYTYTNRISEKVYVGQTVRPNRRYTEHKYGKNKHSYIDMAIKKYGIDMFIFKIIEEYNTQKEANQAEEQAIKFYDCLAPYGYNIQPGGNVSTRNPESIKKGAETRKRNGSVRGEKNPFSKINQAIADEMREMRKTGSKYIDIANKFSVSHGCVSHVLNNRTWVKL